MPSGALTPLPILTRSATNPFPPPVFKSRSLGLPSPSLLFCPQRIHEASCGSGQGRHGGGRATRVRAADSRRLLLPPLKAEMGVCTSFPSPVTQPAQVALTRGPWSGIWSLPVANLKLLFKWTIVTCRRYIFTPGPLESVLGLRPGDLPGRLMRALAALDSPPQSCGGGVGQGRAQMQDTPNASISSAEAEMEPLPAAGAHTLVSTRLRNSARPEDGPKDVL